eukprot:5825591-Lingulodinium_polyedra.AAC.1
MLWDEDVDGLLNRAELPSLARCVGFDGPAEEFGPEYEQLCSQYGRSPEAGVPEAAIMALLDG